MRGIRAKAVVTTAMVITTGLGLTAGGAGPAGAAPQPKGALADYCAQVQQIGDEFGNDPGVDAIFESNPDPTLAEWAAFLPGPIAKMQRFADDITAIDAPKALAADVANVLKRWRAVIGYYEAERQAAAAGDQKAFEAGEARRDGLVRKLGKAMQVVGKKCGFPDDGGE